MRRARKGINRVRRKDKGGGSGVVVFERQEAPQACSGWGARFLQEEREAQFP
jgi:hypothetical protein